jgi:hypothetical protein
MMKFTIIFCVAVAQETTNVGVERLEVNPGSRMTRVSRKPRTSKSRTAGLRVAPGVRASSLPPTSQLNLSIVVVI